MHEVMFLALFADVPVLSGTPQVTARQHAGLEIQSAANGISAALPQSSAASARTDEDGNAKYIKKKGVVNSFLSGFRQGSLLPITTRSEVIQCSHEADTRLSLAVTRNSLASEVGDAHAFTVTAARILENMLLKPVSTHAAPCLYMNLC